MNTRAGFSLIVLLISSLLASIPLECASLMLGTIRFPPSIHTVPAIRIYCGGRIITSSIDQKNKTISFSIPRYAQQSHFPLVIAEKVSFAHIASKYQSATNNTAAYMKLDQGQPYKFYSLLLVPEFSGESEQAQLRYTWRIKNEVIDSSLKLPDDAIIICCDPNLIDGIHGTNNFELPTIVVTPNVLKLSSSEQSFYEKSTQIMLASLDSDAMHAPQDKQPIRQEENRIIIAAPAA